MGLLALIVFLFSAFASSACAATLGPAATYQELVSLLSASSDGDTILIDGAIVCTGDPLGTQHSIRIQAAGPEASLSALRLRDASVVFSGVSLDDSLSIDGTSHVQLSSGARISGASGKSALRFSGNGTLIIDRGCTVSAADGETGVNIQHTGGEFYGSIEGSVSGGANGGSGVVVSPLTSSGAIMIDGHIRGGDSSDHGGHALNLYDLSGNAYVTIAGNLRGGDGTIGGNGIQLVSAGDEVNVGIDADVKGGSGDVHAGDAMILMNAAGASSISLSGHLAGGDASESSGLPGTSLQLVGDSSASRARILNCILEDGRSYTAVPEPEVTPLPEIVEDELPVATPGEAIPESPESESVQTEETSSAEN